MTQTEIFPWNPGFETGLPVIDAQHRQLVELLNRLAAHLAYRSAIPEIEAIFDQLAQYAAFHFQTEESIWAEYLDGDDSVAQHKLSHQHFVTELLALKHDRTDANFEEILERIVSFLTRWLAFHILDSDKRMAQIALAVGQGVPLETAKRSAEDLTDAQQVLIKTILRMYENLSSRTLQLMKEVAERQRAETKLRLFAKVFENTLEAICITDPERRIIDVNVAFCQATKNSSAELLGKPLDRIKSGFTDTQLAATIAQAMQASGHWAGEIWNRNPNGELEPEWLTLSAIKNSDGEISHYVNVFSSVGELIKRQRYLEHAANHDALTGLPNRLLLADRMNVAMELALRTKTLLAVCYLDLDGFKPVNDHWGHKAGDEVLKQVAVRLKSLMRKCDTVARLGGDEFVLLLGNMTNLTDCDSFLTRVLAEIERPTPIAQGFAYVSASIGVTIFPLDNVPAMTLLLHADQGLYQAKNSGKSCFSYCSALPRQ
ncbi:bacteriohemerythrin [Methylomonas koyamae]|uniref:GGDEF domain-containing protein n=1 Tax=Methylomonas koyamae TaxID=702114 RepID=A0AA91DFX2_9GAMM|nr:bacteriohemerythrin [Methylomonas koyamae]OAI29862.1 hypothetical protein A1356_03520 [Methylomonas koyamae]